MFINIHSHNHSQSDFQITLYDLQGDKPLLFSIGIHPWDAQEFELNSKFLEYAILLLNEDHRVFTSSV